VIGAGHYLTWHRIQSNEGTLAMAMAVSVWFDG